MHDTDHHPLPDSTLPLHNRRRIPESAMLGENGDSMDTTLIDHEDYLLFVPDIRNDVIKDHDPSMRQRTWSGA